ncbi:MAG: polysaccharide biosynthesis tyrosine autokinase [Tannerella sp.]|nr:polysaccharide biosynthesis tyrosine autokinase [Tannerella sp.]
MSKIEYRVSLFAMILSQETSLSKENPDAKVETPATNHLANEIIILSSYDLIKSVVDSLHLNVNYSTKNIFGRHSYLYRDSPYRVSFSPTNEATAPEMDVLIRKGNSLYVIDGVCRKRKDVTFQIQLKELPATVTLPHDLGTLSVELTGHTNQSNTYYVGIKSISDAANELSKKLNVFPPSKLSSALRIDIQSNNIDKGAAVLEELIRQYNEDAVKEKKSEAANTSAFIDERLKELLTELASLKYVQVRQPAAAIKSKSNKKPSEQSTRIYMQQTKQRIDAETQLRVLAMVEQYLTENDGSLIPNVGVKKQSLSQAISDYNDKIITYERLKNTASDESARTRVRDEQRRVKQQILKSIQSERATLQSTISDSYKQPTVIYDQDLPAVPARIELPQQDNLSDKEKQKQTAENLTAFLMQKREEANIAMVAAPQKAKIIVSPSNGVQILPRTKTNLLLFLLLGMIVPLLVIFLKDFFRKTIGDRIDLKQRTQVDIIGEICSNPDPNPIVMAESASPSAELFRVLRNNIDYYFNHQDNKLVLVTSSIEDEGKSYISLNLAIAFSLLGKSVLLVDTNLRKPNLTQYLSSEIEQGLTQYLTEGNVHWQDLVEYIDAYPNLHILKTGAIPTNPNELLMNRTTKQFIGEIKGMYDYIFLDASPLGLFPDVLTISEYADLILYVVREGRTPRSMISLINKEKSNKLLNNLHIVYNDVTLSKTTYLST